MGGLGGVADGLGGVADGLGGDGASTGVGLPPWAVSGGPQLMGGVGAVARGGFARCAGAAGVAEGEEYWSAGWEGVAAESGGEEPLGGVLRVLWGSSGGKRSSVGNARE